MAKKNQAIPNAEEVAPEEETPGEEIATKQPEVGGQVHYLAIKEIGGPVVKWAAEITAVYENTVDLVVHGPGGYVGVCANVPHGDSFGQWCYLTDEQ